MINLLTLQYDVINCEERMGIPSFSMKIPNYIYHDFAKRGLLSSRISLQSSIFLPNNPNVVFQQMDYTPPKHFEESVVTNQKKAKNWWNIFSP